MIKFDYCLYFLLGVISVFGGGEMTQTCQGQLTCNECLAKDTSCSWCEDFNLKRGSPRCDLRDNLRANGCHESRISDPKPKVELISNRELGTLFRVRNQDIPTALKPQRVRVTLRPGNTQSFTLTYRHAGGRRDINMVTSSLDPGVNINFLVTCKGRVQESSRCRQVENNEQVVFNTTVIVSNDHCEISDKRGTQLYSIGISGVSTVVALELHPLCSCECAAARFHRENAQECNRNGKLICGYCVCNKGYGGDRCECPTQYSQEQLLKQCIKEPGAAVCSARGICQCGTCQCSDPLVSGDYCDCDQASCPYNDAGKICSGNGKCQCGNCMCDGGYSGPACNKMESKCDTNLCISPGSNKICSGNGQCMCDKCKCNGQFSGQYCSGAQEKEKGKGATTAQSMGTTTAKPTKTTTPGPNSSAPGTSVVRHVMLIISLYLLVR